MQTRATAYSPFWRVVAALLVVASRGSLLAMAFALAFLETALENPLRLLRTFVVASVAPGLGAWLLARAFAARVAIVEGLLTVERRDGRVEVPCDAVTRIVPWTIPSPGAGVSLDLAPGAGVRTACKRPTRSR
jgi:hypothetical protein